MSPGSNARRMRRHSHAPHCKTLIRWLARQIGKPTGEVFVGALGMGW